MPSCKCYLSLFFNLFILMHPEMCQCTNYMLVIVPFRNIDHDFSKTSNNAIFHFCVLSFSRAYKFYQIQLENIIIPYPLQTKSALMNQQ